MPRTYSNKFNRGEIDEKIMTRDDVERVHNACSLQENFLPSRAGYMEYRSGSEYMGLAKVGVTHKLVPFVDDGNIPTMLEFSSTETNPSVETVRMWVDGVLQTTTATLDTIVNEAMAGGTGWGGSNSGAGSNASGAARWKLTGGTGSGDWGRISQTYVSSNGERTVAVSIEVSPILIQIGTNGVESNDIFEGWLAPGYHVMTFDPGITNVTITFANDKPYSGYVAACGHLAAGDLEVTGLIFTDNSGDQGTVLDTIRFAQVNDVLFLVSDGYSISGQQIPIVVIKRRAAASWSFEIPEINDGPFGPLNLTSVTLTPSVTIGDGTLTASQDFFSTESVSNYYQIVHGGTIGICQVIAYTSSTVVDVRVVQAMGATTASLDWYQGYFGTYLPGPTSIEIYEGRMWLAGGARIYASVSDQFTSFDSSLTGDSAAISRTIGFGPVGDVSWLIGGDVLMMGLSAEEVQVLSNGDYDSITPTNIRIQRGTNRGAAAVKPAVVDQVIYFVQRGLKKIFALSGLRGEKIEARDITLIHPEITDPGITRIQYVSEPEPRLYVLLSDSSLRVVLFDDVENVLAWSRITIGGSVTIHDLAASPSTSDDEVYMIVERAGIRSIERFADIAAARGQSDSRHYDSHVYYNNPGATATGLDHLEGIVCNVWADGVEKGTETPLSGSVTLAETDWVDVVIGIKHTAWWTSNRLARYIEESVLNYRKRIRQIGLIMKSVAIRTFTYGPDASNLMPMPDVEDGTITAPTTEDEPTITDQITGTEEGDMNIYDAEFYGDYMVCACDSVPSPIAAVNSHRWAYYDGALYLTGGIDSGSNGVQEIWKYTISTGVVIEMATPPDDIVEHGTCELDGVIYGFEANSPNDFTAYDVATDTWLTVAQPATSRTFSAIAGYNGNIYQYGGNNAGAPTNTFQVYNVAGDSWSTPGYTGTPEVKMSHCGAAPTTGDGQGKVYFFGGLTGGGTTESKALWEYDIGSSVWTQLSSTGIAAETNLTKIDADENGNLWAFGGKARVGTTQSVYFDGVWKYDISADTWSQEDTFGDGASKPLSRNNHALAIDTLNDKMYIFGGTTWIGGLQNLTDVWSYDLAGGSWTLEATQLAPAAGAVRIFDVSDYENMTAESYLNITDSVSGDDLRAFGVVIEGTDAYFVTIEDDDGTINRGVAKVDISDPLVPVQTGYLLGATGVTKPLASAIQFVNGHLIVPSLNTNGELAAVTTGLGAVGTDLALTYTTNPVNPQRMALVGNYLYISWEDDVHVVDVSNPLAMTVANKVSRIDGSNTTHCIVDGQFLYCLDPDNGRIFVYVLDNPTTPTLLGSVTSANLVGATDFMAFSPWIYVTTPTTIVAVDARIPTAPVYFAEWTGYLGQQTILSRQANILFTGSNDSTGRLYSSDQRSWLLVDYDEMSFELNGTYHPDSRLTIKAEGPCTVLSITYEVEDIDDQTNGSDGPSAS